MFFFKKTFFVCFLLIITSCSSNNFVKINTVYSIPISIETPNDKYNIIFKEYLKRNFGNKKHLKPKFILKTNISYSSTETLSVSGSTVLNSTKAKIEYSIIDTNTKLLIKSGTVETFPALSSSSGSLYSNEKSVQHIKERLTQSSAKKIYMVIKLVLRKLN